MGLLAVVLVLELLSEAGPKVGFLEKYTELGRVTKKGQ